MSKFKSLLEYVCDEIVSFEMGSIKVNDHRYLENILKITSWTEIRHRMKFSLSWTFDTLLWTKCLQPCLMFCNEKICMLKISSKKQYQCCWYQSEGDCECCWARIEFFCMGNIKLSLPSLLRYVHITLIIFIVLFQAQDDIYQRNLLLYVYIAIVGIEMIVANCLHYFSTRFKFFTVEYMYKYKCIVCVCMFVVLYMFLFLLLHVHTAKNQCEFFW